MKDRRELPNGYDPSKGSIALAIILIVVILTVFFLVVE